MNTSTSLICVVTAVSGALLGGCARNPESDVGVRQGSNQFANDQEVLPTNSDPAVHGEIAKLEGTWAGVSFHIDGLEAPVAQWYRYSFDGDRMTTETHESDPATVRFYLDQHASPKRLDTSITVNGVEEITKGIYALEGDSLKLSWRVVGDRPTDFQSRDGDEKIVLILRRADTTETLNEEALGKPTNWSFKEPDSLAVTTLARILNGSEPILYVVHDENGDWQFLDGDEVSEEEAKTVSLKRIVGLDPSVKSLADLPPGWAAERRAPDQPWARSQR